MRIHTVRYGLGAILGVLLLLLVSSCWVERDIPTETGAQERMHLRLSGVLVTSFASPVRLAVTPEGELLVSDSHLETVFSVDPTTLQPTQGLAVHGRPLAVGLGHHLIFVGNASRRTVEVYDARGRLRDSFGAGAVLKPTDLAVDERERLVFVLDAGAMDVKVFTYQGRLQQVFSGPGAGPGLLLNPTGIAVDPLRGEILVSEFGDSDGGDAAIEIFDYAGNAVDQISGAGRCGFFGCSGGFSRPQGVAVDAAGQIYLADMLLAQVLIFDRATKKIVNTLGGRDAGPPELRVPLDVALGAGGDVFVTSNRTGSVEVFRSGGTQP